MSKRSQTIWAGIVLLIFGLIFLRLVDTAQRSYGGSKRVVAVAAASGPLELVMRPGMRITATTDTGTISIHAGEGLERDYIWEGATRSATLWARPERWHGSMGAYFPGPGEHWLPHNGITRGVLQEGQQHFDSEEEALNWLRKQAGYYPTVYRDDGLAVSFGKVLERRQLDVEVWQILIRGAKPQKLPGSDDAKISVTSTEAK